MQDSRQDSEPRYVIDKVSPAFLIGYLILTGAVFVTCALLISLEAAVLSMLLTWVLGPLILHGLINDHQLITDAVTGFFLHWRTTLKIIRERFGR